MTDYLDEALPATRRHELERYLRQCPHCGEYLRQLRATIAATGQIDTEDLSPDMRDALVSLLQHIGSTIPPQADASWIGEAGPGPSYLDPGSGGPENDFTNRNTTLMKERRHHR